MVKIKFQCTLRFPLRCHLASLKVRSIDLNLIQIDIWALSNCSGISISLWLNHQVHSSFFFFFKQQKGRESNHKSISNAITQSLVFIDTFARITFSILHAFLCYFYYDKLLFSIESDILSILPYGLIETGLFQSYLIEPAQFQTDQSSKCIEAWYQSYPKLLRI